MSLTSRVFGLFTTTETPSDSPASAVYSKTASTGEHVPGPSQVKTGRDARAQNAASLDEEEPRPPYLHVRSFDILAG